MSEKLYVVMRTHKTAGRVFLAGDVVSEEEVLNSRYGKVKIRERKLQPLPQDQASRQQLQDYFAVRWGTDFAANVAARVSKGSSSAATENRGASAGPTTPGTHQTPPPAPQGGTVTHPQQANLHKGDNIQPQQQKPAASQVPQGQRTTPPTSK